MRRERASSICPRHAAVGLAQAAVLDHRPDDAVDRVADVGTGAAEAEQARGRDAELRARRIKTVPAGRFGTQDEFGAFCAFLCSVHAGYMTAQNVLLDGGHYPGTF